LQVAKLQRDKTQNPASDLYGINDAGEIVGQAFTTDSGYGVIYSYGTYTVLSSSFFPVGINNAGQIVSFSSIYSNGVYTPLDLNIPGARYVGASAINNNGQIVENFGTSTGSQGFLYSNGAYTIFPVPPGTRPPSQTFTYPYGINNADEIIGACAGPCLGGYAEQGFIYYEGNFSYFGGPLGDGGLPLGINDAGDIVGAFTNSGGDNLGFVYSGGVYSIL
jgi:hypothetical protein